MQVLRRAAIAMALALPLATLPLTAQKYRWDFNVNGGFSWLSGDLVDRDVFVFDNIDIIDPELGFIDPFRDVSLGDGGIVGAQLGYWFGGSKRVGLRANFAYTNSDVDTFGGTLNLFDPDFIFDRFDTDVNLWSGSGDLLVRLKTPNTRWDGMEWLPYVALGLGAQWINPAGSRFFLNDNINILDPDLDLLDNNGNSGVPIACRRRFIDTELTDLRNRCAFLEEGSTLMGLLGIGMDVRLAPSFALRFEFGDRIWEAPIRAAVQVDPDFPF